MNDKDLLNENGDGATRENLLPDATENIKASPEADCVDSAPSVANDEGENTESPVKPKRKYTRRTPAKNTDTESAQKSEESKDEDETVKPKRKYTRKTVQKNEEISSATEKESEPFETDVDDIKSGASEPASTKPDTSAESQEEKSLSPSDNIPSESPLDQSATLDLFVEEEFSFIPEFTEDIFEDVLNENLILEENATSEDEEPVDRILPPDELFADRSIIADDENSDSATESSEETEEADTAVDDDGQYRFTELDELMEDEFPEPDAIEPIQEKYDPKKPRSIDGRFDLLELFVFTLLAVMIATTFLFRHSIVEGASMENTLHSGEHLIISDLFYTPKRGDIIVCEDYTTAIPKPIVKRVIAVAGDTLEIKENGNIYVNGELIEENYLYIDQPGYKYKEQLVRVAPGELFVMGDHRNESTDSREIGTVSEDSVLGKVLIRFYPFDKFGTVK